MEAIIDKFQQLSQRISQDRSLYASNDTLLGALVVGEGFIAGKTDLEDEDKVDDDEEEAQEESLFMEELPKGDSAYIDRLGLPDEEDDLVEEEVDDGFAENIQWLNSLKPHIVSCFLFGRSPNSISSVAHSLAGELPLSTSLKLRLSCNPSQKTPAGCAWEDRIQHQKSPQHYHDCRHDGTWEDLGCCNGCCECGPICQTVFHHRCYIKLPEAVGGRDREIP